MAKKTRPQGLKCHNFPCQARPKTIRDPTTETRREVEKTKESDKTWDLQHTFDSHDSLEVCLIPSHLFSKNVRARYDEGEKGVKELRSTTDLR